MYTDKQAAAAFAEWIKDNYGIPEDKMLGLTGATELLLGNHRRWIKEEEGIVEKQDNSKLESLINIVSQHASKDSNFSA